MFEEPQNHLVNYAPPSTGSSSFLAYKDEGIDDHPISGYKLRRQVQASEARWVLFVTLVLIRVSRRVSRSKS